MDVALELLDRFVLDQAYANLIPIKPAPHDYPYPDGNSTAQTFSTWQYEPSTKLFSTTPTQYAYMSSWPRDYWLRQSISVFLITWIFGLIAYYIFSALSYYFVFDHETFKHPKFLKNQVKLEMIQANIAMPGISLLTTAPFMFEVKGYTKLYDVSSDGPGLWYDILQFPFFLLFTDCFIYLIHRGLHHPLIYKHLHKPHHKWIMPTPFASYAFHPVDGFAQSIPYHVFPILFPMSKHVYLFMFIFVNFWTILIHDGEYYANNPIINGAACHSIHHIAFNYNYGQYTTLWDRLGGSYRKPEAEAFNKQTKMSKKEWDRQVNLMEQIVKEVEGEDDRTYGPDDIKKTQ